MKAIVTRPNSDGTYDEVGMRNRYLTSQYKTERGLLRYGIADYFKGTIRIELFSDNGIFRDPYKTIYITK